MSNAPRADASYPILAFPDAKHLEAWLEEHHTTTPGLWLRFYKKNAETPTVTYQEAVDLSLRFGWIDSQVKKYDDVSYLQKFTPRGPKSLWSKINREKVERFIAEGSMRPLGVQKIEEAKKNGQWDNAYASPSQIELPEEFLSALKENKKAATFFKTLNKANIYAITWRLQTALKPETKQKRLEKIISMLENGEMFH